MRQIIQKGDASTAQKEGIISIIEALSDNRAWVVTVQQYRRNRSLEQNSFLHAVPLRMIADETGHDIEDMKTYLLGERFGWMDYFVMGMPRKRPLKRSHELNTTEFAQFIGWIQSWASRELGLLIPDPNEIIT